MSNNKPGRTGLSRIIWAARYSYQGTIAAWQNEAAVRQELCLMLVLVPAAFFIGQSLADKLLLVGVCFLVLITELLNSAIEAAVDRIGPEMHPLSGRAKDIGSAAVFFALCFAGLCWLLMLWQFFK